MNEIGSASDNKQNKCPFRVIMAFVLAAVTQTTQSFFLLHDTPPAEAFSFISYLVIFWIVSDWFMKDSKKHNVEWAYDMGFFLFLFWPVLVPFHLFKTRGFKYAAVFLFGCLMLSVVCVGLSYLLFCLVMP